MIVDTILAWALRRRDRQLLDRFGGIQQCPWCRQTANQGENWGFTMHPVVVSHDVLTCGVCGGTSLWMFTIGMFYVAALEPPKPMGESAEHYWPFELKALNQRCCEIADNVVPAYRGGAKSYPCTGHIARQWGSAWEAACLALGGDLDLFNLPEKTK